MGAKRSNYMPLNTTGVLNGLEDDQVRKLDPYTIKVVSLIWGAGVVLAVLTTLLVIAIVS